MKFKQGDLIEGIDKPTAKARILAVTDKGYKVFGFSKNPKESAIWVMTFEIAHTFYRKAE